MTRAIVISSFGHVLVLAAVYVGVPHMFSPDIVAERVIVVDLVSVAAERNLPKRAAPEPEPKPEPEPVPETPPPAQAEPAPPPPPEPEPEIQTAAIEPTQPAPAEQPEVKPEPPKLPSTISRPRQKPKPPKRDTFDSLLRSIEDLEDDLPQRPKPDPEPDVAAADLVDEILAEADTGFDNSAPLSMSEMDSIRYQIQKNWSIPAGARDAHEMRVTLRIQLSPDGTVIDVSVVNATRMQTDPFFRTMAESTVRAVLLTGQIKNLSPEKYHLWRDMRINFDPSEMIG